MKIVKYAVFISGAFWLIGAVEPAVAQKKNLPENYYYEAVPSGKSSLKETFAVGFARAEGGIVYTSSTSAPSLHEEIKAVLDAGGEPGSLERKVYSREGELVHYEKIWLKEGRAYLKNAISGGEPRSYAVGAGKRFSVGSTITVLLRGFPFDSGEKWEIFALDFSGRHITLTARNAGGERVKVPAGEFDCYKMELTVNVPILRPKIYCWLTKAPPHFLVKQTGKRGPFTPNYVTVLTGRN